MLLDMIWLIIHTPITATYPMVSLADVMSRFVDLRQRITKILYMTFRGLSRKVIFLRAN